MRRKNRRFNEGSPYGRLGDPEFVTVEFDDGMRITAKTKEKAIDAYKKQFGYIKGEPKIAKDKPPRSAKELDRIAMHIYDTQDVDASWSDDRWYDFTDEELAILWSMCMITQDNPWGRAYDDEVYDAINSIPYGDKIFNRADDILDGKEFDESLKEDKDNKLWAILRTDKETGKQYYDDVFDNKEYAHYYAALNSIDYPHYGYGDFTFSVVPMSEDEYNQDVLASQLELHKLTSQRSKDRKSRSLRDVVNRAAERLDKDSSLDDIKYTIVDELDDAFDNWSEEDYSNVFDDVITAINGHNGPFIEPINK